MLICRVNEKCGSVPLPKPCKTLYVKNNTRTNIPKFRRFVILCTSQKGEKKMGLVKKTKPIPHSSMKKRRSYFTTVNFSLFLISWPETRSLMSIFSS